MLTSLHKTLYEIFSLSTNMFQTVCLQSSYIYSKLQHNNHKFAWRWLSILDKINENDDKNQTVYISVEPTVCFTPSHNSLASIISWSAITLDKYSKYKKMYIRLLIWSFVTSKTFSAVQMKLKGGFNKTI
jgi:hypothetical protein